MNFSSFFCYEFFFLKETEPKPHKALPIQVLNLDYRTKSLGEFFKILMPKIQP